MNRRTIPTDPDELEKIKAEIRKNDITTTVYCIALAVTLIVLIAMVIVQLLG